MDRCVGHPAGRHANGGSDSSGGRRIHRSKVDADQRKRVAARDGHIASGDYLITVENTSGYVADSIGNQCFDDNGVELTLDTQEPLSVVSDNNTDLSQVLVWAGVLIVAGGALATVLVLKRRSNK